VRVSVLVSIPFIAGQWSLPGGIARCYRAGPLSFNPLHCGAVVSSLSATADEAVRERFNPLHCGAVVSSDGLP